MRVTLEALFELRSTWTFLVSAYIRCRGTQLCHAGVKESGSPDRSLSMDEALTLTPYVGKRELDASKACRY